MERIVFLERNTFDIEIRRPQFDHEWLDYGETEPSHVVERLRDVTIAIVNKLPLRQPDLSQLPQLKLIAGVIGGAAFDVLSEEPPRQGNILLDQHLPNLIVTPHVGWASKEAMQTLADQLIDNIEAFIRGEPKNLVV